MNTPPLTPKMGVFDSGVGGLTVLKAIRTQLPDVDLLYVADVAHAPYGERSSSFLAERALLIAAYLIEQGCALLVVACNTATAHAVQALRARWPEVPVVGIEPGIKPAVSQTRNGRVGVMATSATLASERFQQLLTSHGGACQVFSQACPGLARLIEEGDLQSPALAALIEQHCAPLRTAQVDTVLLGCTHYPLAQPLIQTALGPQVHLLNIESAVARQAQRLWPYARGRASVRLVSTGTPTGLTQLSEAALGVRCEATRVEI